jgi:hypothetical protein
MNPVRVKHLRRCVRTEIVKLPVPTAPASAALRGPREFRRCPVALTERGGRERALQFRQCLTFELARTFACHPKLATDCRQRLLFAIEAEAQFDQALFALGQRPQRSDDCAPPGR